MGDIINFPGGEKADSDEHILLSPVDLLKYCVEFTYKNGGLQQEHYLLMYDVFVEVDNQLRNK